MEHTQHTPRALSPLEQLTSHFEQIDRKPIACPLVNEQLYSEPLTAEDFIIVRSAEKKSARQQVRDLALLVVSRVKLEDGRPAFSSPKGPKAAAEQLATQVPPQTFFEVFEDIFDEASAAQVTELGND